MRFAVFYFFGAMRLARGATLIATVDFKSIQP